MNTTPRTDADKACDAVDTLASQCKLNPTAYQREAKEAIRQLETELQEAQKERDQLRQQLTEAQAAIVVKDEALKSLLAMDELEIGDESLLPAEHPIPKANNALQPNCGQPLLEVVKEMMKGLEVAKQLADHAQDCDCVICKALTKAKEIGL